MASARTRVSVIVPTCDRHVLLREALASIRALEGEDLEIEILVGDNGAVEAREIVDELGGVYLRVTESGAAPARNAGLLAATGEYLAFLDDDDIWTPEHLRMQLEVLRHRPDLDAVFGQVIATDLNRNPIGDAWPHALPVGRNEVLVEMLSGYKPQIGATVARIAVRDSVGLFDPALRNGQDWDWQIRVACKHEVGFIEAPCVLSMSRPVGASDELQLRHIRFARRIFSRHAHKAKWPSPMAALRAYHNVARYYYRYFLDAAVMRAENGEKASARRAIWSVARNFPVRTARQLLLPTPLQRALLKAL